MNGISGSTPRLAFFSSARLEVLGGGVDVAEG